MLSERASKLVEHWAQNCRADKSRPSWDAHFMEIAITVAKRSLDARTNCGAVLVANNTVLSTGYNSFIRDIDDNILPNKGDDKYPFMIHAEHNALLNCAREGKSTLGATCYVTGKPCISCLQLLWQSGISEIVYGNQNILMNDDGSEVIREVLLSLMKDRIIYRKFVTV